MSTSLVVHGHFYQPPRENPWTQVVDREESAAPFHDWNERIHHECYRGNAFARIVDEFGKVERIVNNYENISFNFGPTLLSWIEQHDKEAYKRILEGDRVSVQANGGHGNAIAQAYNHAILPLCNERDMRTQIRWGLADFRYRFGRDAEAMWLPETACNQATLGALIDEGMRYILLSPYQAERVHFAEESNAWSVADGSVDPGVAYRCDHPDGSGRSIAAFFYDGPIARAIAFDGAVGSSQGLVDTLARAAGGDKRVVHVATDGESYGHHTRFGDKTLAYALEVLAPARGFRPTNYGAFLEQHAPKLVVEIKQGPNGEGTAWSCAHGVGRWYRNCGCQGGGREGFQQAWRGPLRRALDLLRDAAALAFSATEDELLASPWSARDAYINVLLDPTQRDVWLRRNAAGPLGERDRWRALAYLEMQHAALKMYTSCGFFFSDISGIETVQILKYAGRALDLMEELGLPSPRDAFLEVLAEAKSNYPEMGTGADVFTRFVEPLRVPTSRVAANLAVVGLVDNTTDDTPETPEERTSGGYTYARTEYKKQRHGRITLATSRLQLEEKATGRKVDLAVAAMHLGGIDFYCVLKPYPGAQRFHASLTRIWTSFRTASLPILLRVAQEELGPEEHGLESVAREERQKIAGLVLGDLLDNFAETHSRLYQTNQRTLDMLHQAGLPPPQELRIAAELTIGRQFDQEVLRASRGREIRDYQRAIIVADDAERRGLHIDRSSAKRAVGRIVEATVRALVSGDGEVDSVRKALDLAARLRVQPNLDRAQEIFEELRVRRPLTQEEREIGSALGFGLSQTAKRTIQAPIGERRATS